MIDSHCHLAGVEFAADLPQVVERATSAGVNAAVCILSEGDATEDAAAARVRAVWPQAHFVTGIHPHDAGRHGANLAESISAVEDRAKRLAVVAIGEIGLDYHYDFSPRNVQQQVFRAQLDLARRLSLPVVIHTREATDDTFRLLAEAGTGTRGVFHCFTGNAHMARRILDLGFYLSFAGIVTFPRAEDLREAARMAPADRILLETDAPYLAPVPHRGKRNEPAYVAEVAARLAAIRQTTVGDLGERTTLNCAALFGFG